jgi:hypothetical protein
LHAATKDHYGIGVGRRVSDDPSVCNSRKKRRAKEPSERNGSGNRDYARKRGPKPMARWGMGRGNAETLKFRNAEILKAESRNEDQAPRSRVRIIIEVKFILLHFPLLEISACSKHAAALGRLGISKTSLQSEFVWR